MNNLFPSPPGQVARVGAARVAVIHGDPDSLAGWGFGVEMVTARPCHRHRSHYHYHPHYHHQHATTTTTTIVTLRRQ